MRLAEVTMDDISKEQQYIMQKHEIGVNDETLAMFRALDAIKKDCQPYLQSVDYQPFTQYSLYRGITALSTPLPLHILKDVRLAARKPKDTSVYLNGFINDYFETYYGEPFRQSVFVTSSQSEASTYGALYLIFPTGDFTFLWSPEWEDLYNATAQHELKPESPDPHHSRKLELKFIDNVLSTYTTKDFKRAILSKHEIMIRSKSYHGISMNFQSVRSPSYTTGYQEYLTL